MKEYIVQFGNHFLQTDDFATKPAWTDLAHASVHTQKWAENFAAKARDKENQIMHVMTMTEALASAAKSRDEKIKSTWLYAFEQMVFDNWVNRSKEGLWCNAHMHYAQGLSVSEAVKRYAKALSLKRKQKKRVKV